LLHAERTRPLRFRCIKMDSRPILLEVTATTLENKPVPELKPTQTYTVMLDAHAGPNVSSGANSGACFSTDTKEEAMRRIKAWCLSEADWLISYRGEDDKVYKIDRKVIIKLTVDGVKTDVTNSVTLTDFFS
jgi:hypothetical protein